MMGRSYNSAHDTMVTAADGRVYAYGPRVYRFSTDGIGGAHEYSEPPTPGEHTSFWCVFAVNFYDNEGRYVDHWKADCDTRITARILAEALAATGGEP